MTPMEEVVLSLMRFEHRYVPYEGARRKALVESVLADLGSPVDAADLLRQAYSRTGDIAADALGAEPEQHAEHPELTEEDVRELTVNAACGVAWCEGFAIGMFHARRLAQPDPLGGPL